MEELRPSAQTASVFSPGHRLASTFLQIQFELLLRRVLVAGLPERLVPRATRPICAVIGLARALGDRQGLPLPLGFAGSSHVSSSPFIIRILLLPAMS